MTFMQLLAPSGVLAAAAESRSPLIPPLYDIVWSALILAVIAFVLVKFVIPAANQLADERAAKIQAGIDLAAQLKDQAAQAEVQVEAELQAARDEAVKLREEAKVQAEDIVRRAQAKANEESKRIMDTSQRQLEAERQAAQLSLRSDVGLLAVELAEKIVGEQLQDRELSARVVDRFLADLEKAPVGVKES